VGSIQIIRFRTYHSFFHRSVTIFSPAISRNKILIRVGSASANEDATQLFEAAAYFTITIKLSAHPAYLIELGTDMCSSRKNSYVIC